MISSAASSRISTAKGRASSARLTGVDRWSSALGSSKPSSSISSRKTNAWSASGEDDKQEELEPLVRSLFAHVPATVYFFVEGEKGIDNFECFPLEYFGKRIFHPRCTSDHIALKSTIHVQFFLTGLHTFSFLGRIW